MNVLLLDQYSDLGGAQQALLEMLPAVRRRGWRAVVGIPGNGKLFDLVRDLQLEAARIDCWSPLTGRKYVDKRRFAAQTYTLAKQIQALAARIEADLVYVNGPRLAPAAALARLRCPVLFHSHSWLPPGRARTITGLSLRWLDARVVANCEFVAEQWRRYTRAGRISVVWNGVAGPQGGNVRRLGGPLRIGCIGRIGPEKGQREFVECAAQIHAALPDCRLLIYGEARSGDVAAEAYASEVRSAAQGRPVEFRGWVYDVYQALAELDLLLVPSVGPEATTRVILEAYAAGVPAIAFDSGGISEVVENGVTGILVRSVDEMARESVALLRGDPEKRIAMARAGRTLWEQRFTMEKFHADVLQAMEECAHRQSSSRLQAV